MSGLTFTNTEAPSWWQFIEVVFGSVAAPRELKAGFERFRTSLADYFIH
jgi:hypothetical protein